ncbi:MAG: glycosyltransferase [Candidatus Ancillula sp.]|nr:glycosyltransferase [Candidatus Ancillula sp.]
MKIALCIPTYCEADNIAKLLYEIDQLLVEKRLNLDVFVLDDNSPDGTAKNALDTQSKLKSLAVKIISGEKAGLGSAYKRAFEELISTGNYTHIVQMDADFSHPVSSLVDFIKLAEDDIQLAIGSRYIKGGSIKNWSALRSLISKFGNFYLKMQLNSRQLDFRLADYTGGFNMYSAELLQYILPDLHECGYTIQVELKFFALNRLEKLHLLDKVVEFPIVFEDRTVGVSKMPKSTVFNTLKLIARLRKFKHLQNLPECCR